MGLKGNTEEELGYVADAARGVRAGFKLWSTKAAPFPVVAMPPRLVGQEDDEESRCDAVGFRGRTRGPRCPPLRVGGDGEVARLLVRFWVTGTLRAGRLGTLTFSSAFPRRDKGALRETPCVFPQVVLLHSFAETGGHLIFDGDGG